MEKEGLAQMVRANLPIVKLHRLAVRGGALSFVSIESEHNILARPLSSVESLIRLV